MVFFYISFFLDSINKKRYNKLIVNETFNICMKIKLFLHFRYKKQIIIGYYTMIVAHNKYKFVMGVNHL